MSAVAVAVEDELRRAGVEPTRAALVVRRVHEETVALARAAIMQSLAVNELVDMEWRFGGAFWLRVIS